MRTITYNKEDVSARIVYPNEITYGFNPNYVEFFDVQGASYATIAIGRYEITVSFYENKARADIGMLVQSQFTNPIIDRAKEISLYIAFDGKINYDLTIQFLAIWGSSSVGERLNYIGAYHYDKTKDKFVRNVRLFVNYPQKLSVFNNFTFEEFYPTQREYDYDLETSTVDKTAVFDNTFDRTFVENFSIKSYLNAKIYLHEDASKNGYFLRWIDNFGMYQYFLFLYGERTISPKQENEYNVDITLGGYFFGGGKRMLSHSQEKTYVGCAVNLTKEESKYVQTIINSPVVDMFLGTIEGGEELWIPVVLKDADKSFSEKKEMEQFEITFIVPTSKPQQL